MTIKKCDLCNQKSYRRQDGTAVNDVQGVKIGKDQITSTGIKYKMILKIEKKKRKKKIIKD